MEVTASLSGSRSVFQLPKAFFQIVLRVLQRADVTGLLPPVCQSEVIGDIAGVEIEFLIAVVSAAQLVACLSRILFFMCFSSVDSLLLLHYRDG